MSYPASPLVADSSDSARRLVLCVSATDAEHSEAQALWAELATQGWRCHHVSGIAAALQAVAALRFDALLVSDHALGGALVQRLAALREAAGGALLVLAHRGDEIDEILALELGADDYLYPPFNPRRLRARLAAAVRLQPARAPRVSAPPHGPAASLGAPAPLPMVRAGWSLDLAQGLLRGAGHELRLTSAQAGVLALLLARAGHVVPRGELATRLGLPHTAAGVPKGRSIDMHLHHLRRRLQQQGIAGLVIDTVRGIGYMLRTRGTEHRARASGAGPQLAVVS